MREADHSERGIATALAYVSLFSQCSKRELRLVAKPAKTKEVAPKTVLVNEGDEGDSMFVLVSGHAVVHKNGRKIADLELGHVVGELAALSKAPRNATVTTTTEATIATIGRRELSRLIEEPPGSPASCSRRSRTASATSTPSSSTSARYGCFG